MAKAQNWEELARSVAYRKYSHTIERRDYRLPDGTEADFYICVKKPGAAALALTEDGFVITMPQFRPGPGCILRELPGGQIEPGDNPRKTAVRELLEETGYAGEVAEWSGTWYSDAYSEAPRTIIIVKNCKKVAQPRLDGHEFGEVELVPVAAFVEQARKGQLTDAAGALLALDHLGFLHT